MLKMNGEPWHCSFIRHGFPQITIVSKTLLKEHHVYSAQVGGLHKLSCFCADISLQDTSTLVRRSKARRSKSQGKDAAFGIRKPEEQEFRSVKEFDATHHTLRRFIQVKTGCRANETQNNKTTCLKEGYCVEQVAKTGGWQITRAS